MEVGGQRHAPAALPRETPGTHCTGGWVVLRPGLDECGKSWPPPGFDPRTVQSAASRYIDWAIPDRPGIITGNKTLWYIVRRKIILMQLLYLYTKAHNLQTTSVHVEESLWTPGPSIFKFNADCRKMCVYKSWIDTPLDVNRGYRIWDTLFAYYRASIYSWTWPLIICQIDSG
jgi:hypothetical protein